MKKAILAFSTICITLTAMAANEKYYQKMGEALAGFNTCSTIEGYQEVANQFNTIAQKETAEWLPLYYETQCYILMSFMENSGDINKDALLDQAESSLEKLLELAPLESEAYAMKAFYHTGRLVVNPPQRAQTTAPLVEAAIGKSLGLDPGNPRAKFMSLSNEMGTARFFGSDLTPFCKDASELLEQWDSYKVESAIHPSWGKGQVEEIVQGCGE
jgi:hypothetical protein